MKLSSVIRAQLKRFLGWRISVKAIARVLRKAGYAPVHRKGWPVGGEQPRRFEAPHRGALWQLDFTELRVGSERRWLLVIGGVAAELGIGCGRLEREAAGVAITSAS